MDVPHWDDALLTLENEYLAVEQVEAFAPDSDTQKGGDIAGWLRIPRYYDHAFDRPAPCRAQRLCWEAAGTDWRAEYDKLHEWCDELTAAKVWLEGQANLSGQEKTELKNRLAAAEEANAALENRLAAAQKAQSELESQLDRLPGVVQGLFGAKK